MSTFRHLRLANRRQRRTTRLQRTLPLTLALVTVASACSVDRGSKSSSRTTPSSPTSGGAAPATVTGVTAINVILGGQTLTAELYDNPTARDLASRLPLTVTLDDLHGLEKTGRLPAALTTNGVPRGSDPEVNEIGYYAPGCNLVFYYGDVGYFDGIIRIGRFDAAIDVIRDQPDGFSVTVERAS